MASALTPIVAFNHGAKNKERIDQSLRYGFLYGIIMTIAGTAVCVLLPGQILDMFNATENMKEIGMYALCFMASGYVMLAVRNVSTAVVQALGHSVQSVAVDLCRSYVVLLPLAWVFSRSGIVQRVFWAYSVADISGAVIGLLLVFHFYKKDIKPLAPVGAKLLIGKKEAMKYG